jgi:hypothetical protein
MTEEQKVSRLTPAMRWVLIGAGVVVVVGAVVVGWLLTNSGGPGGDAGDAGSAPSGQVTPTQGPLPDATPTSGSEVIAPTEAPQTSLPPVAPVAPAEALVAPPYPASGSAEGELVAGYPSAAMPPSPGADVLQSSIATEGDIMQVTLLGRTDASPDDVRAFYAAAWSALGLADQSGQDGTLTVTGRGASMSLAFTTAGTGTRYTVYGVFRAS